MQTDLAIERQWWLVQPLLLGIANVRSNDFVERKTILFLSSRLPELLAVLLRLDCELTPHCVLDFDEIRIHVGDRERGGRGYS